MVAKILAAIRRGRTRRAACGGLITDDVFKKWCDEDPVLGEAARLASQEGQAILEDELMEEENTSKHNARRWRLAALDPEWIEKRVAYDGGKMSWADAAREAAMSDAEQVADDGTAKD